MSCGCPIWNNPEWFWDCTNHNNVIFIEDIRWKTLRQVICQMFNTTSGDIRNSPWLYWICWKEIQDYWQIIDDSFIFLHLTKRRKRTSSDEFFRPKWQVIITWTKPKKWRKTLNQQRRIYEMPNLTLDEYTFCSDYFLIVPFDPKDNSEF